MKILFDIESTGLLRRGSTIHCIVARDLDNLEKEPYVFDTVKQNVDEGVDFLQQADLLAGHNIVSYDLQLLKELYPNFKIPSQIQDTLIYSRIFFPQIADRDYERQYQLMRDGMTKRLFGSHGLKAWGYRLGFHKGTFGEENDWSDYSPAMLEYCIQDVNLNVKLWQHLTDTSNEHHRKLKQPK